MKGILFVLLFWSVVLGSCNQISGLNDLKFKDSDSVPPTDTDTVTDPDTGTTDPVSCRDPSDCEDGPCVDGFCCNAPCDGTCEVCNESGHKGECRPVAPAVDPDSECEAQSAATCGRSGTCDGKGACAVYGSETTCDDGDPCTTGDVCGSGVCAGTPKCTSGTWCDSGTCTPCNTDDHCGASCQDCPATGLSCNAAKTACVLTNCAGKDDFTWCEIVTAPMDRSYDICISGVCRSPGCGDAACNAPGPHFPLADTNQRGCYDSSTSITCPSAGQSFYGQDAQYGWDATHAQTARYTRTEPATDQPIVQDNVTGLVWQGCPRGLKGNTCATAAGPAKSDWSTALSYCDSLSWGGHTDWRLPDEYELDSIWDAGKTNPAIDTTAFPATPSDWFWSSSSHAEEGGYSSGWTVAFEFGWLVSIGKDIEVSARCVRSGP